MKGRLPSLPCAPYFDSNKQSVLDQIQSSENEDEDEDQMVSDFENPPESDDNSRSDKMK